MTNQYTVTIAQADFDEGINVIPLEIWKQVQYPRWISSLAVVGSTNPNDCGIEVLVGGTSKGTFPNSNGGANLAPEDVDRKYPKIFVGKGQEIQLVPTASAIGNPVVIEIKFDYARPKRTTSSYPRRNYSNYQPRYQPRRQYNNYYQRRY